MPRRMALNRVSSTSVREAARRYVGRGGVTWRFLDLSAETRNSIADFPLRFASDERR